MSDHPLTSQDEAQWTVRLVDPQPPSTRTSAIPAPPSDPTPDSSERAPRKRNVRRGLAVSLPIHVELAAGENRLRIELIGRPAGWQVMVQHWQPGYPPNIIFQTSYNDGDMALEVFRSKLTEHAGRLFS